MKRINPLSVCLFVLITLILACPAFAEESTLTATEIIRIVDENEKSDSSRLIFSMSIYSVEGSRPRDFSILSFENSEGDSLIEFTDPRTVKGMRILSKGNNSWVFFPSTGRIRKIGSSSRSGSVQGVGGDFSYDDLGSGSWEADYQWELISEDTSSWELRGKRTSKEAAYDQIDMRVDKTMKRATACSFSLASEGGLYKRLELSEFTDYSGRLRPAFMVMKNLKKGSYTEVRLQEAGFDIALDAALFDPARFNR